MGSPIVTQRNGMVYLRHAIEFNAGHATTYRMRILDLDYID